MHPLFYRTVDKPSKPEVYGVEHLARSDRIPTAYADCVHVRMSLPSPLKTSLQAQLPPERPSEAAFETPDFRFYLACRETF